MTLRTKSTPGRIAAAIAAILWFAVLGIIGFSAFSYLLPQDLTRTTQPYAALVQLSFFGRVLGFHLAILLALLAVAAIWLGRRGLAVLAVLGGAAVGGPGLIHLWPHQSPQFAGPSLRVMSMNLKYAQSDADLIVGQIQKFNPDLLVIQDCTPFAQSAVEKQFGADYPHRYVLNNGLQGLAIFSRLPFAGPHPRGSFGKIHRQLRAVVSFNGQNIAVYIEHPSSPRTRQRIVNNRLATLDLANQLREEKLPAIVAGDFNFTAETTNQTALVAAGLQDSFDQAGHGRGSTWPVHPQWLQWFPGVRIDHIFVSQQLTCTHFFVGGYDGSDHLPIVADIAVSSPRN